MANNIDIKIGIDGKEATANLNKVSAGVEAIGKTSETTGKKVDKLGDEIEQCGNDAGLATTNINTNANSIKELGEQAEKSEEKVKSFTEQWSEFFQGANQGLELLKKGAGYAKSAFDFLREGADLAEAEANFRAYTASVGKSANKLVIAIREATNNQISDVEIMTSATKAMRLAGVQDIEALTKLYQVADAKGDMLGVSLQETFDQIVTAITSGNGRALIQLGLLPESFARASDAEALLTNKTLLLNTALKQGEEYITALAGVGETASDNFNQLEAAVSNLAREFKINLSQELSGLVNFARTDGVPMLKTALELAKEFMPVFKDMLSLIRNSISAFVEIEKFLQSYGTGIADWIERVAKGYRNIADAIKTIKSKIDTSEREQELLGQNSIQGYGARIEAYKKRRQDIFDLNEMRIKNAGIEPASYMSAYDSLSVSDQRAVSELNVLIKDYTQKQLELKNALKQKYAETAEEVKNSAIEMKDEVNNLSPAIDSATISCDSLAESIKAAYLENRNFESSVKGVTEGLKSVYSSTIGLLDKTRISNNPAIVGVFENMAKAAAEATNEFERLYPQFEKLFKFDTQEAQYVKDAVDYLQKGLKATHFKDEEFSISKMFGFDVLEKIYKSGSAGKTIEKTADKINSEFRDAIASSISEGFARADFSGFAESLGVGIRGVVGGALGDTINSLFNDKNMGSLASDKGLFKQIYSKNSSGNTSLNLGALASNVGIGLGLSFLTSDGGLLGKRKIVGAENINKSAELNAQVDQAKALRDEMFLALGVSEYTRQLLDEAEFAYTYVTSKKSGSIFNRKKTYTIHNQDEAQSSIKYLEDLQKAALGEQAQRSFATFNLGRSDSIQAAAANLSDAQSAYNASQVMLYGGKTKNQIESEISAKNKEATNNYNLYAQFANLSNQIGGSIGNQYKSISNQHYQTFQSLQSEIGKLVAALANPEYKYSLAERTQMQQQLEESKIALAEAIQTARTGLTSSFLGSATLASLIPKNSSLMNMLLGNSDVTNNSSMIQTMLPLLEKAGFQDFDLTKAFADAKNDPQKMLEAYNTQQGILQSASSVYEQLYKDAKAESLNSNLSIEEQMAAFERFQDSFNAFLEIQNQILTNTQTIAEIEKQNFSKSLTTDLSDALSVFGETMMQTNSGKTEVYYQTLSASELLAKLKNILKENKTANADALIGAINELEELETWGD